MRSMATAICLCWFSFAAYGQAEFGSISGSVYSAEHAPLANIAVEAKSVTTGNIYKATSSRKGEYTFGQLTPGKYEISVFVLTYRPFLSKNFAVVAGQSQHLDIQLAGSLTGTTLGEIPAFIALFSKRPPPPTGPVPRTPDGKPDLSGVWMMPPSDLLLVASQQPDLQPWAEAVVKERLLNEVRDKPGARCLPEGVEIFFDLFPIKIVQTRTLLVALTEGVIAAHQVFLDGRGHPSDLEPTWLGHSIAKWDGDTLVIDTVGFNDKSWLFVVVPHTEMLHITTRLQRPDLGHLRVEATYDDPGAFKKPVTASAVEVLAPMGARGSILVPFLAFILSAWPALAHHSFSAEYDADKPVQVAGMVTKIEWENPHVRFYVDVKDDQGNVTNWNIELGPPGILTRLGWRHNSLKIGDQVTVEGYSARDGSKMANAKKVTLADGRSVFAGSSAQEKPTQ